MQVFFKDHSVFGSIQPLPCCLPTLKIIAENNPPVLCFIAAALSKYEYESMSMSKYEYESNMLMVLCAVSHYLILTSSSLSGANISS